MSLLLSNIDDEEEDDYKSIADDKTSVAGSVSDHSSEEEQMRLAQKETKAVFGLRVLVILVLLLAAVGVSLAVYFITSNAESAEYDAQFTGAADKVLSSFENIVGQKMGAIGSFCLGITSFAESQSEYWPFVTLEDFEQRSASARTLSNALHMSLLPLVTDTERSEWEDYSVQNLEWYLEGRAYQEELAANGFSRRRKMLENTTEKELNFDSGIGNRIYQFTPYFDTIVDPGPGPYTPVWQSSPVTFLDSINMNLIEFPGERENLEKVFETGEILFGGLNTHDPGDVNSDNLTTAWLAGLLSTFEGRPVEYKGDPITNAFFPIFDKTDGDDREVMAIMKIDFNWASYFENILPDNSRGVVVVLENCEGAFTYEINGAEVDLVGVGDQHDRKFTSDGRFGSFKDVLTVQDGSRQGMPLNQVCPINIHVYPSQAFYDEHNSELPLIITISVGLIFVFTSIMFIIYDRLVERRQRLVMHRAKQTTDIVSSLFPANVRDRLIGAGDHNNEGYLSPNHRLATFLKGGNIASTSEVQQIADLFPYTTVCFADIAGFTAWSSTREPAHVFVLLQTVYQAFDIIAKKRRVFKVETIGDSYVAVTGLPEPQETHAVIMARFAWECMEKMSEVTKRLEVTLGPDTADLSMRIGIHSGPVTAGVLRGERARFQLFGDTVNTASRMESTGERNKIQVSNTTAKLLEIAGKTHWIQKRDDSIVAKGKGVLNTYWVSLKEPTVTDGSEQSTDVSSSMSTPTRKSKQNRLIEWVVELMQARIKNIVAQRNSGGMQKSRNSVSTRDLPVKSHHGKTPLDDFAEVIKMPKFDYKVAKNTQASSSVVIPPIVVSQLRELVTCIASMYHDNPFHNFEHACHVTMAVDKFLRRIVAPDLDVDQLRNGKNSRGELASHLHDYTHGINSDPISLFAIVFSALIHDVDHRGVSNAQLVKEEERMGMLYNNTSVAEQNSLDISWQLLMSENFGDLRAFIFGNEKSTFQRFRQVVVNVVLATDIFDKELNNLRKNRWNMAFGEQAAGEDENDLKATIVIEHIIQASDVSHTMQHWHIYRKWNACLFKEMYLAYKSGRTDKDPSENWYEGEKGFFDFYIIPLAKKLKDCNVFGVSSDECLNYAIQNRAEWEVRGEAAVQEMMEEFAQLDTPEPSAELLVDEEPVTDDDFEEFCDDDSKGEAVDVTSN
uniref:Phosphodiesterase n=1 Tax=Entomoneis paludosa TaxID=265537 RepID=A0A7S3DSF0_9STRA|eukprot:CAMPEP_0172439236 /NCGR_PEP_ID=MMETSP1065-20121228/286_1 /TAXON_ID=265537 /ORGANISM="Amphiprora paludosa, Strain CCMP125" /LENGTH=1180 /DNA_ID=CAMNT_0013187887 /DNA_START=59 /DNA_END=3601 /DNA_ORIENTATION=-